MTTTDKLIDLLKQRHEAGLKKYGVTVDRTDLTPEQWAQHAIEELLDGAAYLMREKEEIAKLREENRKLKAWKEQSIAVWNELDTWKVANCLGAKPGDIALRVINERVPKLVAENAALRKVIVELTAAGNCLESEKMDLIDHLRDKGILPVYKENNEVLGKRTSENWIKAKDWDRRGDVKP